MTRGGGGIDDVNRSVRVAKQGRASPIIAHTFTCSVSMLRDAFVQARGVYAVTVNACARVAVQHQPSVGGDNDIIVAVAVNS